MAGMSISFYLMSGSDIQWRNIAVVLDPSWWPMLPGALLSFTAVIVFVLIVGRALAEVTYSMATIALDVLYRPISFCKTRTLLRRSGSFDQLAEKDDQDSDLEDAPFIDAPVLDISDYEETDDVHEQQNASKQQWGAKHIITCIGLVALIASTVFRPSTNSLISLSWTLPLLPIADVAKKSALSNLHLTPTDIAWENVTALAEPIPLPWLPKNDRLLGFEDWYMENKTHYNAAADPLKISNLDDDLLSDLRNRLHDVPIRHVIVLVLESTRRDVFPIKKDGFIWDTLANSYANNTIPPEAEKMLSTLTSTANFLTGDYEDGFQHDHRNPRGGIVASNAHTGSSYTLKSLVATLCGLAPVAADFNVEFKNHFYQPCLPHILKALNSLDNNSTGNAQEFARFPWRSMFMQSATGTFDYQGPLMSTMGFSEEDFITREYLQSSRAKFGKQEMAETNYFSIPEVSLEDYIRDAFRTANTSEERVFLSHLTSTTHHAWGVPESETYVPLAESGELDHLSHYLNCIRYQDRWLEKILTILEEEGVANETMVIITGDHGTPVAEGGVATYNNPETISYEVPLVFSHPNLPPIKIDDAVTTLTVIPTLLDLLIESGSLSKPAQTAAHDLLANLEGQSLLRPLKKFSEATGQGDWQFTVTNPGGTMVSVRDARHPAWHLVVPLDSDNEWRFVDLDQDPKGKKRIISFDMDAMQIILEKDHGIEASNWIKEAAVVCRWWVKENNRRWRYGKYADMYAEDIEERDAGHTKRSDGIEHESMRREYPVAL